MIRPALFKYVKKLESFTKQRGTATLFSKSQKVELRVDLIRNNLALPSWNKPLKHEAMLMGQGSDWLRDQQYFLGSSFSQNLESGRFQVEY